MEKYIRTIRNPSDAIRRFFNAGVVLSFNISSPADADDDCVFAAPSPFFDAPYPASVPEDIVVVDSCEVSDDFHPRFSKSRKTYEYRILNARFRNPTRRLDTYFYHYPLDTEKMSEAAKYLIGEHDFASFCSANSQAQTTVRTIYDCTVSKAGDIITIRVTGNGFLYNMVRIIAGTLVKIGGSDMPADAMKGIIAATDRAAAGPTAPAQGLTMIGLKYE